MSRKQILLVALLIVVASSLSALVAYRRALRQGNRSPAPPQAGACLSIQQAAGHAGEMGCVTGRVLRVYTSRGGHTFLDFCSDYRNCPFNSVIFASDREKFGNLRNLTGRRVEMRGAITVYQGRTEIILRDPEQLYELP